MNYTGAPRVNQGVPWVNQGVPPRTGTHSLYLLSNIKKNERLDCNSVVYKYFLIVEFFITCCISIISTSFI